jgi:hypothetical protein
MTTGHMSIQVQISLNILGCILHFRSGLVVSVLIIGPKVGGFKLGRG